jgi:hypothetical protein
VDTVQVDAKPEGFWNLAIEFCPGPRLVRLRVVDKDKGGAPLPTEWTIDKDLAAPTTCGANGLGAGDNRSAYLCPAAPQGALIGKFGGSPADIPDLTQSATPFGTKKVFAVGAQCVISLAVGDAGPLYLTMNDELRTFDKHDGMLFVEIHDATA